MWPIHPINFAILISATDGYDGSMMNNLQSLPQRKDCKCLPSLFVKFSTKCKIAFDKPDAASRDLLEAVVFVGSIVGLHIVTYVADILGS